jgi:hypothetical protein
MGEFVRCLDLDEDASLPENLSVGSKNYRSFEKNLLVDE